MNDKTLSVLEFHKVLNRLAAYTAFAPSRQLALNLRPGNDLHQVQQALNLTSEARRLRDLKPGFTIGGARDIGDALQRAGIGATLEPADFLDIRATLISSRAVRAALLRLAATLPLLAEVARTIQDCPRLEKAIATTFNDRGEIVDDASPVLKRIRVELRQAHDRLLNKLNDLITSPGMSHLLQESLVMERDGRYVIPIKADFKGQFRGIVHDQSASGATLFMEPLATVELNNTWRELQLDEQREIHRILRTLTNLVADHSQALRVTLEALAEIDLALAKAAYADDIKAIAPHVGPFGPGPDPATPLVFNKARHPLLDPQKVVPITIHLGRDFQILIITGPNTGGKTVALKTTGLLTLMAQAGMHLPADEGTSLPVFRGIYADIGDEQSIEQSLSTFSGHLANIIDILSQADSGSLVLLDELGAGTDPVEGSALARALLGHFLGKGMLTLVATHYAELKAFAHATPGVENASVEFDVETLSPTYRLSIGLPGRSNALAIAQRLGLPMTIIEAAQGLIDPGTRQVESLLQGIQREREEAEAARLAAQSAQEDAEKLRRRLSDEYNRIEDERRRLLAEAREKAEAELTEVRQRLRRLMLSVEMAASGEKRAEVQAALEELKAVEAALPEAPRPPAFVSAGPLAVGSAVWVKSLNQPGDVVELDAGRNEAEVQVGSFKVKVALDDLEVRGDRPRPAAWSEPVGRPGFLDNTPVVPVSLDLRGWRAEEVAPTLDQYLNDAYLGGLPWVRLVHGKGTGVLRQVVREFLAKHPLVKSFRTADPQDGGEGVTIAVMAT